MAAYTAEGVHVELRRVSRRWMWRLVDFFDCEIERGTGLKTKLEARVLGARAKVNYLKSVSIYKIKLELANPK